MSPLPRLAVAALLALAGAARAAELGDSQAGHAYAKKVCSECHEVERGEAVSPYPDVPSFQTVADTPGMTDRALAVWLQTSHPNMPDFILKEDERDNVIAYIMSLHSGSR